MKKLLFFFLTAMLLLTVTAALAATAKPGEEVTLSLSLQNTNASYVRIKASYDASVFELVGYSANNGTAGSAGIVMYDVNSILPSGQAGTVTLRVKSGAKPGDYTISAVLAECYDRDENNGKASAGGGGIVTVPGSATPAPTATPTAKPTDKPTAKPTAKPTDKPTATPAPTAKPTDKPTAGPTAKPTDKPTGQPTAEPTAKPTNKPTAEPTAKPTDKPTGQPTAEPTAKPTDKPTEQPTATPAPTALPQGTDWRFHQTVCSLGIRFRDIAPQLTREWDMFTPLDLSREGEQTLPLLAANVNEVGAVTIAVKNGAVTVTYKIKWPAEELDMAFALLPDLASVTEVNIASMPRFAFGQPVSIQNDLGGDTRVLLYVLGHVDYDYLDPQNLQYCTDNTVYPQMVSDWKALMD